MTVKYTHNDYTLIWSDGDIADGMCSWFILDKWQNLLGRATTNDVPPTEKQAKLIIEATTKALGRILDQALLYGMAERKPLKGDILDFKMEVDNG